MLCKHGCKLLFFQSLSYYIVNMVSWSPKTWCKTHFMSSIGWPPDWDFNSIRTPSISSSNMSKTGKIQKQIRYISVITQKSVIFKKSKIDFKSTGSVSVSLQPLATITHAALLLTSSYTCYLRSVINI